MHISTQDRTRARSDMFLACRPPYPFFRPVVDDRSRRARRTGWRARRGLAGGPPPACAGGEWSPPGRWGRPGRWRGRGRRAANEGQRPERCAGRRNGCRGRPRARRRGRLTTPPTGTTLYALSSDSHSRVAHAVALWAPSLPALCRMATTAGQAAQKIASSNSLQLPAQQGT